MGKTLEAPGGERHKFGNAGDVPVGVGDFGVTDVGGKRREVVPQRRALATSAQQRLADEAVAQVMNTRGGVAAARPPAKFLAKFGEGVLHGALVERFAAIGDEECRGMNEWNLAISNLGVALERPNGRRVQWN